MTDVNGLLRRLPQIDEMLAAPELANALELLPRQVVVDAARSVIDEARASLLAAAAAAAAADGTATTETVASEIPSDLASQAAARALSMLSPSMRRVVNAAGVVVHTNLGRSVLAPSAVDAVIEAAGTYSTLEYDVENMSRGSRHDHCERLICMLTGAEAAIAVNNNAAAVMMVLSEFARGHEAVVSRGELVEIGGSFRIPDIMALSDARMVEVGTTNKTHAADYAHAIDDETAMLLKVHTSNYRLVGFVESVPVQALRKIADEATAARRKNDPDAAPIMVYADLGSGALMPFDAFEGANEPTAGSFLSAGCDLVSFSGDKLLGGPQAGIIIGSKELIDRLKKNPLARAMRLDKMTIAALEATLRLYLDPAQAIEEVPTLRMLFADAGEMRKAADRLAALVAKSVPSSRGEVDVVEECSRAGGGALPMVDIPTWCVRVRFKDNEAQACNEFITKANPVCVIGRLSKDALLFDVRTLLGEEDEFEIARALGRYFEDGTAPVNGAEREGNATSEPAPAANGARANASTN